MAAIQPGTPQALYIHSLSSTARQYSIQAGLLGSYQLLGWAPGSNAIFAIKNGKMFEKVSFGRDAHISESHHLPPVEILAFSPAGGRFIALTGNGNALVMSLTHSERSIPITLPSGATIERSIVDPTESFLAEQYYRRGSPPGAVVVNLKTGSSRLVEKGVASITFSDGHFLVQDTDGTVDIWNLAGTVLEHQIHEDQSYLPNEASVQTSPVIVGGLLVQERSNSSLTVTQLSTGEPLASLTISPSAGLKTGLAADQRLLQLISVTQSSPLRNNAFLERWNLSPQAWIQAACASAGRSLTRGDWHRYVNSSVPEYLACTKR
jgi:hypothetical protein